jgi:hypothetical protein
MKLSKDSKDYLGSGGESVFGLTSNEEINTDKISLADYRSMLDTDGQVQMLYHAITNTILSAGVELRTENEEMKEFFENIFFGTYAEGGFRSGFNLTNRYILRALIEGFRAFEIIYRIVDGKIVLEDIAPRSGRYKEELVLLADDFGRFRGVHQKTLFNAKNIDVEIINEDNKAPKIIKATIGQEFGSLYGRSLFKPAWYHFDKVHKLLHLFHVASELGSIKYRQFKTEGILSEEKKEALANILERVGQESYIIYSAQDGTLEFNDVSDPSVMAQMLAGIDKHYSLISKSVLAQFIDLGSVTTGTGSRSTSEDHQKLFKQGLESLADVLIEEFWNSIIQTIYDLNFTGDDVPKLIVNPINDSTSDLLFTIFTELTKGNQITDTVKKELIKKTTDKLGLDIEPEEIDSEFEEEKLEKQEDKQLERQQIQKEMNMNVGKNTNVDNEEDKSELSEDVALRPLYPDEQKIAFADIKVKMDTTEQNYKLTLQSKLIKQKDEIVNNYIEAIRRGYGAVKQVKIELAEQTYSDELYQLATEMFEYGKLQGANELGVNVEPTKKKDTNFIASSVALVVSEQENGLKFRLQNKANELIRRNAPENEAKLILEMEYSAYMDKKVNPTLGIMTGQYFNEGLQYTFSANESQIWGYRYTAILDGSTTAYCRAMDGRIFQKTDPEYVMRTPPQHFGCRSRWSAVTKAEQSQYGFVVDGAGNMPLFSGVDTFKDLSEKLDKTKLINIENELDKILNED